MLRSSYREFAFRVSEPLCKYHQSEGWEKISERATKNPTQSLTGTKQDIAIMVKPCQVISLRAGKGRRRGKYNVMVCMVLRHGLYVRVRLPLIAIGGVAQW